MCRFPPRKRQHSVDSGRAIRASQASTFSSLDFVKFLLPDTVVSSWAEKKTLPPWIGFLSEIEPRSPKKAEPIAFNAAAARTKAMQEREATKQVGGIST